MSDNFLTIPNTHWNSLYFQRKFLLEALQTMQPLVKGKLLDVGCGTQPYRSLFKEVTAYIGVDIASSCHSLLLDTILYDGETLPFPPNSFDWVMATEVLEHARCSELLLSSIYNVIRPGGGFFLSVPFLASVHEAPNDFRRWTNYGLIDELKKAGFESIEVRPLGTWHSAAAHFLGIYLAHCHLPWWTKYWFPRLMWVLKNVISELKIEERHQTMCIGWFGVAYKPMLSS